MLDDEIIKLKKILDKMQNANLGPSINDLEKKLLNDPENKELRFEIAEKYMSLNETEKGFNELLHLFNKDPKWKDETVKKKILEHFDLLGLNDPNVINARKKLSSLMFK